MDHKNAWPFLKAVDTKRVPDYYDVIKDPMGKYKCCVDGGVDLERVSKNLEENVYQTKDHFKRDLQKIFENARTYNQQETIYYKYANQLEAIVRPMLDRLKETEMEKDSRKQRIQMVTSNAVGGQGVAGPALGLGPSGLGLIQNGGNEESFEDGQGKSRTKKKSKWVLTNIKITIWIQTNNMESLNHHFSQEAHSLTLQRIPKYKFNEIRDFLKTYNIFYNSDKELKALNSDQALELVRFLLREAFEID